MPSVMTTESEGTTSRSEGTAPQSDGTSSHAEGTAPHSEGTSSQEENRPNDFGFAGGGTAPQPKPDREPAGTVDGEAIAIPAGDITGAVSEAIEEATQRDR
jgi:hypothetical protein